MTYIANAPSSIIQIANYFIGPVTYPNQMTKHFTSSLTDIFHLRIKQNIPSYAEKMDAKITETKIPEEIVRAVIVNRQRIDAWKSVQRIALAVVGLVLVKQFGIPAVLAAIGGCCVSVPATAFAVGVSLTLVGRSVFQVAASDPENTRYFLTFCLAMGSLLLLCNESIRLGLAENYWINEQRPNDLEIFNTPLETAAKVEAAKFNPNPGPSSPSNDPHNIQPGYVCSHPQGTPGLYDSSINPADYIHLVKKKE